MKSKHPTLSLRLPCDLSAVARAGEAVERFCRRLLKQGAQTDRTCTSVKLCLSEVLTNIIRHSGAARTGDQIVVEVGFDKGELRVRVCDYGRELPRELLKPRQRHESNGNLEALCEGGFGWQIINTEMDDVRYARVAGQNRLTLTKVSPQGAGKFR